MNEQEKKLCREKLRWEYKDLENFKNQFLFWQNHHSDLTHFLDSRYVEQYISATKNKEDVYLLEDVRNLIDEEFKENGYYEPIPISDEDKSFIGEYWFNEILHCRKKEKPPIYDYKTYKEIFLKEVVGKADKLEYATKELINVSNYLENLTFNTEPVFMLNGEKKSVKVFFEDLTNNKNDFMPDFAQLYECSILDANISIDLYYLASYHIPLNQYKRLLKMYIEKNGSILTDKNKLSGYDLGFSKKQLNGLYLRLIEVGFLNSITEISHFINALDGNLLSADFEVIKWKNKTKGAVFIKYYLGEEKMFWNKFDYLFEKANYKQLYNQSKRVNDTLSGFNKQIELIDKEVSKISPNIQ